MKKENNVVIVKKNPSEYLAPGGRGWHAVPGEGVLKEEDLRGIPSSPLWGTSPARGEVNGACGFTLIELLVVVLIIGILAAVVVPQYKHAALKSRFSTVMPMAKSIADANEVFYLGKNYYANNSEKDLLDVFAEAGTTVELSTQAQEDQYNYVAASRSDVPGVRYIVYQKYSPKFANNIHCEADKTNEDALWLCEHGLRGTDLGENSLKGSGYKTFVLAGNAGDDSFSTEETGDGSETSGGTEKPATLPTEAEVFASCALSGSSSCTITVGSTNHTYDCSTGAATCTDARVKGGVPITVESDCTNFATSGYCTEKRWFITAKPSCSVTCNEVGDTGECEQDDPLCFINSR